MNLVAESRREANPARRSRDRSEQAELMSSQTRRSMRGSVPFLVDFRRSFRADELTSFFDQPIRMSPGFGARFRIWPAERLSRVA